MDFEIVGDLADVETIATGRGIRELPRLPPLVWQGPLEENQGRRADLRDRRIRLAERHWYEAHGIGNKEFKRKKYLD